ncbi:MAG: TnpV protein [Erysipelotrichaceae bacterium]|nr:TnpV protein [Erysipelotrichaceae bacterium]
MLLKKFKEDNMIEWVRKINNIRNRAAEIVNSEVIFI